MRPRRLILLTPLLFLASCTNVWVAPNGLDSNPGTEAQPKRTLAGACQVAGTTRVITMKGGTYPEQQIPCSDTKVVEDGQVIIRATSPSSTTPTLDIPGSDVSVTGPTVTSNNLKRKGVHVNGDRVKLDSMDIGNVVDDKGLEVWGTDFTLEDSQVHAVLITNDQVHSEGLFAVNATGIKVLRNTFQNVSTYDLVFTRCTWCNPPLPQWGGGTVEGNTFYHTTQSLDPNSWHYNEVIWYGGTTLSEARDFNVRNNRLETRRPGNPGEGGFGLDIPWVGGERCGNSEFPSNLGVIESVWKVPC